MSIAEIFEISETDTVWDAWLTTANLIDMIEHMTGIGDLYNFADARNKISKTYSIAEIHLIDRPGVRCSCGLSDAEHTMLKRKILTFFALQISNLKRFVY